MLQSRWIILYVRNRDENNWRLSGMFIVNTCTITCTTWRACFNTQQSSVRGKITFLVALSVGWSVGWSVCRSVTILWRLRAVLGLLLLLLVYFINAPAHPHATWVAVYPALFLMDEQYGLNVTALLSHTMSVIMHVTYVWGWCLGKTRVIQDELTFSLPQLFSPLHS